LFDTTKCDAVIETKSIIHAMVNFIDGSTTAHLANANMQLPISYAILDKVETSILEPVNLLDIGSLDFKRIETSRYPIWELKDDLLKNDNLGLILNSANEIGVEKFLKGNISFMDISKISLKAVNNFSNITANSIDDIYKIDKEVRNFCLTI
jgi:1-deoxy-D-xylulose-5-phosphate reductoisomerase